jgi:hypothetical protein
MTSFVEKCLHILAAKSAQRRAHRFRASLNGGHAEPVIGRAFARPVGSVHPTQLCSLSTADKSLLTGQITLTIARVVQIAGVEVPWNNGLSNDSLWKCRILGKTPTGAGSGDEDG